MTRRPYVPLDLNFADDPAILACSPEAQLLYVRSLAYVGRLRSDGWLCERQAATLCSDLKGSPLKLAEELTREGLWIAARDRARESTRAGFMIAAWSEWNLPQSELDARKEKDRERKTRARASEDNPLATVLNGTDTRERAREPYSDEFETLWKPYPLKKNRKGALKAYQARRRQGVSFADLKLAVENYLENPKRVAEPEYTLHGATFFGPNERWKDYLESEPEKAVEKPSTSMRRCGSCGAVNWMAGTGPVPCDCPADGEGA